MSQLTKIISGAVGGVAGGTLQLGGSGFSSARPRDGLRERAIGSQQLTTNPSATHSECRDMSAIGT